MEIEYKFCFYFYGEHVKKFESYFEKNSRLTLRNEDHPDSGMPAMFLDFEKTKFDIIVGRMKVLLMGKTKTLENFENKKFYLDAHDLVGHVILLG